MSVRILGLDPGLRLCGWGVIDVSGSRLIHVSHGVIKPPTAGGLPERLARLEEGLVEVLKGYAPQEATVEETFVNRNPASTLKLGMARGVVLLVPARFGLVVGEYSANRVKKAVTGVGHGAKQQVAMMIQRLLPAAGNVVDDAADALAVAICHAHFRTVPNILERAS
ncbi:MAG: crossover junction endodeoxyribonuclease RuvC [bacterium]|nr:crossover junction endodeoxyribonuclease RuvC [bacterium]